MSNLINRYSINLSGTIVADPNGPFVLHADVARGAVIIPTHEATRLLEDSSQLDWLQANVTHLEHSLRSEEDGYWPHTPEDEDPFPNFFDLTLRQYIARRIAGERGRHADPEPEYESGLCSACNGSGEGACSDAICQACRGIGEVMRRAA